MTLPHFFNPCLRDIPFEKRNPKRLTCELSNTSLSSTNLEKLASRCVQLDGHLCGQLLQAYAA